VTLRPYLLSLAGLALGFALACADDGPHCDSETEMRVTFGSDIAGEPDGVSCEALPSTCDDDVGCDCLVGERVNGINLDFCLENGACEVDDGLILVSCPGG
jgi:hypothetical protein